MKIQIDVRNLQKQMPLRSPQIISRIRKILRHEGVVTAQLSFVFVTDQRMKSLNKKYLHDAYPTDVLAFDFSKDAPLKKRQVFKTLNGEIVISTGAVRRQAKQFCQSLERELMLYVIHGILHLLGFDDHRPCDIKRLRARENKILAFLKI